MKRYAVFSMTVVGGMMAAYTIRWLWLNYPSERAGVREYVRAVLGEHIEKIDGGWRLEF